MATVKPHNGRWRAQVYVKGQRASAVRTTKREAQLWAAEKELEFQASAGGEIPTNKTFGDLLKRYRDEVTANKRGSRPETLRIERMRRDPIAAVLLRDLGPRHFADWRDRRLLEVSGSSVSREMTTLSHVCTTAQKEWQWLKSNPLSDVSRPKENKPRSRRPTADETERLLATAGYGRDKPPESVSERVACAYLFACETAMRAGEICGLTWDRVFDRHVHLPTTKTDTARDVPLSVEARRIVEQLRQVTGKGDLVFGLTAQRLDGMFRKLRGQAMIDDLHFHDTRREALTRLATKVSVLELARISGHKDLRILSQVYYAPDIADLADKLD